MLTAAQEQLAAHLRGSVDADPIAALVPANPVAWAGYVWPASKWIASLDDDSSFCLRFEVGLVFDLVAGVTDLAQSQRWLNDRVEEALMSFAAGVEVLPGERIEPSGAQIVGLVRTDGAELLVARIDFTPFTLEVE